MTEEDIAAVKPKLRDVQDADVAKAVVRALNARRAEQAAALSGRLMQRSKARADAALALVQRQMREAAERKAAAMKEVGKPRCAPAYGAFCTPTHTPSVPLRLPSGRLTPSVPRLRRGRSRPADACCCVLDLGSRQPVV